MDKRDQTDGPTDPDRPSQTAHAVAPEIAIELAAGLDDDKVKLVKRGISDALAQAGFEDADVVIKAVGGRQRIGIWTGARTGAGDREAVVSEIQLLIAGERNDPTGFAFQVSAALIERLAAEAWDKVARRWSSTSNAPDPKGDVHLKGFRIDLIPPERVTSTVELSQDRTAAPAIEAKLVTTDTLGASGDRLQCRSATELDKNVDSLFGFVVPLAFVLTGLPQIDSIVGGSARPDPSASVGSLAITLFPKQVLVPRSDRKLAVQYQRVTVTAAGITGGGRIVSSPRERGVTIQGPSELTTVPGQTSAAASYSVVPRDMRPPLAFRWSGATIDHAHRAATGVTFALGDDPSKAAERKLEVSVTDADNKAVVAAHAVTIHVRP